MTKIESGAERSMRCTWTVQLFRQATFRARTSVRPYIVDPGPVQVVYFSHSNESIVFLDASYIYGEASRTLD